MKRRYKLWIILSCIICFVFVYGLFHRQKILIFYLVNSTSARELPSRWINPVFEFVTNCKLPEKTEECEAIFRGGRDPAILVRFVVDKEEIEKFLLSLKLKSFVSKQHLNMGDDFYYEDTILSSNHMKEINVSGHNLFYIPSNWLKKGVDWWNQNEIKEGRLIESSYFGLGGYKVLVDYKKSTVYVYAFYM